MQQNKGEEALNTDDVQEIDSIEEKNILEGHDILNVLTKLEENERRLSNMEENEIKLFKKLDEMTAEIDSSNYLNIARLSKLEESIINNFKKLDDMRTAINNLNDKTF